MSDLTDIRDILHRAGYTQEALAATIQTGDRADGPDLAVALHRTGTPTPYNTLARLFFLGQVCPIAAVRAAIAPADVGEWESIGLLVRQDDSVRAEAMLTPFEDLFILSDFSPQMRRQPLRDDHVLSVGAASLTLANLTPRPAVDSVLDVGTGSGIQALLASRHATRVIGTDTNRRALRLAQLNATLNGITNVEWREGSLYGPVADCRFDLIVANPPFVISPESRYLYRDSGLPGDTISERVIREAPARLREGGYGVVLFNWHHRNEDDWSERPQQWVAASGCDAWIIRFETSDPLTYAANWLRPTEGRDAERYGQLLDQWLRHYQTLEVGAFSAGGVVLRRRAAERNWVRADTVPAGRRVGGCGEQIERIFAAQDVLEALRDDRHLLDCALLLAPDHALKYELHAQNGGWTVTAAYLTQTQGFEFTGEIDRWVGTIVARCDGAHPLRELVGDLARDTGKDFNEMATPCLVVVRRLMQFGFLSVAARATHEQPIGGKAVATG